MNHLKVVKPAIILRQGVQQAQERRNVPLAIAEIGELFPNGLLRCNLECRVERPARSSDPESGIED